MDNTIDVMQSMLRKGDHQEVAVAAAMAAESSSEGVLRSYEDGVPTVTDLYAGEFDFVKAMNS